MKILEDFVKREKAQNIPKSEKSFVEVFSYSLHKKFYHFWRPLMRTEFDQMTKNNIGWHLKNYAMARNTLHTWKFTIISSNILHSFSSSFYHFLGYTILVISFMMGER